MVLQALFFSGSLAICQIVYVWFVRFFTLSLLLGMFWCPTGISYGLLFILINDIQDCLSLHDIKFLLFCDDLKLFRSIRSISDCEILQNALSSIKLWFEANLLEVNSSKCNVISFTRSNTPISFSYSLDSCDIPRTSCVRDLGVLFDSKLSFIPHMDAICSKATKMLGFISRSTKDFPDFLSFKILYCSLVRGVLEFASCIWNPSYNFHSGRIERIQHKALRTLSFKMKTPNDPYQSLEKNSKPTSFIFEKRDVRHDYFS
uniref:Reverse transcriptase domain-containing protein n=1 Tax=Cacopsylla melanoneura TaxID=428564 RepID=A0A8D8YU09_9HEMI